MRVIHPRPNPIIAAMYTLRDLDVDVMVIHGPAGCGFMASRMIEEAGIRVVTSGLKDQDLIFGGSQPLIETLKTVKEKFDPKTVAVVGTCSSMIIGEDMEASIKLADIGCNVFSVDCHGCMNNNTDGAVKAIEAADRAGIISHEEAVRQKSLLRSATSIEKKTGLTSKEYLTPVRGPTKLAVCEKIADALQSGKRVACAMLAKKELAYRFADIYLALHEAQQKLGGELFLVGNMDTSLGLPRIRRYAEEITQELADNGVKLDAVVGGLDEYAVAGEKMKGVVDSFGPDLLILIGMPHMYPGFSTDNILITDQPRQLSNYLSMGYGLSVGEISSHSMVMGTHKIIPLETGDTLREVVRDRA